MTFGEIVTLLIVLYILYKFVFGLVIPVSKKTKEIREQFGNFQNPNNNNPFANPSNQSTANPETQKTQSQASTSSSTSTKEGEYIDFEEIKD